MRHPPNVRVAAALAALSLIPACADSTGATAPAPKTITAAQIKEMPLERSGDLSVRQNLSDPPRRTVIGRDNAPVPIPASHTPKGRTR